MELREYIRACRRRWAWILVPVLLAIGVAAGVTAAGGPTYRSSMVLFVTVGAGEGPDAKTSRLNSYVALLTGPRVAGSVVAQLKLPLTTKQVQERITAEVETGTDLLVVSATDPSAERSRAIVTTATASLVGLARQLEPPRTAEDGPAGAISVAQEAVTAREPNGLLRNAGFAAVLGLLIGAAAVALREWTRKTVTDEEDLKRLGVGTVGVISIGGRAGRPGGGYPDEVLAEAFRRLRSLLPAVGPAGGAIAGGAPGAGDGASARSLLVTGSNPDEGTTAVACGLAIAIAETGSSVVLVDANLRSPGVGRYLSLDTTRGLTDVLSGSARLMDVLQDSPDGRLTVLPAGYDAPDPGEILAAPAMRSTMATLRENFDVVLVDAPPLHSVADAAVLSKLTDDALLVVRAGHTRTADVERSMDLLERVGAHLAGAVLNALPRRLPAGAAWNRDRPPAPQPPGEQPELIAAMLGDWQAPEPRPAADDAEPAEQAESASTEIATVRGQARVVEVRPVQGRARVVSITDAQPPAGRAEVPGPREPGGQPSGD